jgi:histidine decarboxylase
VKALSVAATSEVSFFREGGEMHESINRRQALEWTAAGILGAGGAIYGNFPIWAETDAMQPPCDVYPPVPGIGCEHFELTPEGLSPTDRQRALQQLLAYQSLQKQYSMGFQANQEIRYREDLKPFLNFHINNVGDPFQTGSFTLNSKWMERAVLDYYARLWNARWPHDRDDPETYWGYVLTMGSTEGNLYGLWNGRDYLAGKCLLDDPESIDEARQASRDGHARCVPRRIVYQQAAAPREDPHAFSPVAFYSEDSHYSIVKAMRILGIQTFYEVGTNEYPGQCPLSKDGCWPKEVPSTDGGSGPGTIDVRALAKLVDFFAARGYPILVNFNYGTTFKGAYDDVEQAGQVLEPIFRKYHLLDREIIYQDGRRDRRQGFWFHVDGALGAAYMPFLEMAYQSGRFEMRGPHFDFRLPCVNSITMSGHKWIGAPWPCGVFMTKTKYLLLPPSRPNYIGTADSTLAGSRNGFSAIVLWDFLSRHSYENQIRRAVHMEQLAEYAFGLLKSLEDRHGDLWVARTPLSLTIRFKRANPALCLKYSLANETLFVDGQQRDYSHIYIMQHVTRRMIDSLVHDLDQPGAFSDATTPIAMLTEDADGCYLQHGRPLIYSPDYGRGMRGS